MCTRLSNKRSLCFVIALLLIVVLSTSGCTADFLGNQDQPQSPTPTLSASGIQVTPPPCRMASCTNFAPVKGVRPFKDTWENIHLFQVFDYSIPDPAAIAKDYDFVWGVSPSKLAAFRAGNPNIMLSYYIPMHRDHGTFANNELGKQRGLAYWKSVHPDWILYRCDRVTPAYEYHDPNVPFNPANPAMLDWQIQTYAIPASEAGYDAIAADNVNLQNLFAACGYYENGQWVKRYTGAINDPQWRADVLNWSKKIYAALHALKHPLLYIPNFTLGAYNAKDSAVQQFLENVDGVLDESGFNRFGEAYLTGSQWLNTVQTISQLQQQNKPFFSSNESQNPFGREGFQYILASYLMSKQRLETIFISGFLDYGKPHLYPEYNMRIGSPLNDMYESQNVYWREFTKGLVIVNSHYANPYPVDLGSGKYVDFYGNHISQTLTLPPHSALILLNA